MDFNLLEEFNDDVRGRLLGAATSNDLEELNFIMHFSSPEQGDVEAAVWQAGYCGATEVANKLQGEYPEVSFYHFLDGQFMAAVDRGDLEEMINLAREGADAFQSDHTALYTPFRTGNVEVINYLINLGLNPAKAFSPEDIDELRQAGSALMSSDDVGRLAFAVVTSPSGDYRFGFFAQSEQPVRAVCSKDIVAYRF